MISSKTGRNIWLWTQNIDLISILHLAFDIYSVDFPTQSAFGLQVLGPNWIPFYKSNWRWLGHGKVKLSGATESTS